MGEKQAIENGTSLRAIAQTLVTLQCFEISEEESHHWVTK